MSRRRRRRPPRPDAGQQHFAQRADLHAAYLASLERGERNPPLSTVYRLAAALEISPADLVPDPPNDPRPGRLIFCPGCDLATSAIIRAYQHGEPCPSCGLPAAVIEQVLAARRRAVGPYG